MEEFKNFEIKNQSLIRGGTLYPSYTGTPSGIKRTDYYDDETDRWIECQ